MKFFMLHNDIELTYDGNKERRCETKVHNHRQIDKLHTMPKTLDCQYFKKLFLNIPLNEGLNVFGKTTILHKLLSQSL
jgi:hypothetical protein